MKDLITRSAPRAARLPQIDLLATYKELRKLYKRDKAIEALQNYTFEIYTTSSMITYVIKTNELKRGSVEARLSEAYFVEYMERNPSATFEEYCRRALDLDTFPVFRSI